MKPKARELFAEGFRILWQNTKGFGRRVKFAQVMALEAFRNGKDQEQNDREEIIKGGDLDDPHGPFDGQYPDEPNVEEDDNAR